MKSCTEGKKTDIAITKTNECSRSTEKILNEEKQVNQHIGKVICLEISFLVEYSILLFAYTVVCFLCWLVESVLIPFPRTLASNSLVRRLSNWWKVTDGLESSYSRLLWFRMQHPGYFSSHQNSTTSNSSLRHAEQVLDRVKKGIRLKMDKVLDAYLTGGDSDFPTCESPVWIFGRSYSVNYDIEELRRSVSSCMWITYRKNFSSIGGTNLTSDKGWGCMIRAGQMLVAKALLLRHLNQDWHWDSECRDHLYLQIVSLLEDTKVAPLSLHQIAQSGASLGKPIGSWLGPNTVAQALKKILSSEYVSLDIALHIAMDSTVVKSEIKKACFTTSGHALPISVPPAYIVSTPRPDAKWKPLLLVVPLRLGLSDLNEAYVPGIKAAFEIPQNIGIIGGRPNHALYFIGYAANEVLYLDPHTVQPTVFVSTKLTEVEKAADETYHIHKPGRMSFSAMDPSIAVCFFCKTEADFDAVCSKLGERFLVTPLPLFEICERRPHDWGSASFVSSSSSSVKTSSKSASKSSSAALGFTTLSLGSSSGGSKSTAGGGHSITRSAGGSPSSSVSGRSKSDVDDEDFEILG
ncbi:Cysteine protease ATG4B [Orchesella cincta]|uniref:Cysteine protease n=1 Tax=Orchesella cincta TaxID=48709 RepID=A0A1D2NA18_ORCCI|nr:Cysteine protease ATG4B [Orchesella cincta]